MVRKSIKFLVFISIILSIQQTCFAQIGINTDNPDTSAVLDISSDEKGVLFPQINNSEKLDSTDGLFFYNSNEKRFYYYNGDKGNWQCVNPLNAEGPDNIAAPNNMTVENNLKVKNNLKVDGGDLEVTKENKIIGYGTTPVGGIIMWSGDTIPDGWVLCNGQDTNGRETPDLRGRFVVGYSESYGSEEVDNETHDDNYETKTPIVQYYYHLRCIDKSHPIVDVDTCMEVINTIPCGERNNNGFVGINDSICEKHHKEGGNRINNAMHDDYNEIGLIDGERKHQLKTSELPHHKHEIDLATSYDGKHSHNSDAVQKNSKKVGKNAGKGEKAQKHKPDATIYEAGNHTHNINGNTEDGSNNDLQEMAHENRPPYYVLAFIMRVK
mgnify:CR=1 FL=1